MRTNGVSADGIVPSGAAAVRSAVWLPIERTRALWELWQFMVARPLLRHAPRGVGRPVLVLPGFLADDDSTATLRDYLAEQGHAVYPWALGVNLGPTQPILDGIEQRITEIVTKHGKPVSLIGVSLGGLFAREVARQRPKAVRQVITLGSPFRIQDRSGSSIADLFEAMSHLHVDPSRFSVWNLSRQPLPMPATAIYTRSDGVVAWQVCVDGASDRSENIEVVGSHSGLVHLPTAVYAVADRLAQPDHAWEPFTAPVLLRPLYPLPERGSD